MSLNFVQLPILSLFLVAQIPANAQLPIHPASQLTNWTLDNYDVKGKINYISIHDTKKPYDNQTIYFNERGMVTRNNTASTIMEQISAMRTIGETTNEYNKKGYIISQTYRGTHIVDFSKITYDYDSKMTSAIVTHYKKDDIKAVYYKLRYAFDSNGRITQISSFRDDKLKNISSFNAYSYDKNGNLISIGDYKCLNGRNCDPSGNEKFTYNDQQQLISAKKEMAGMDFGTKTYQYNDKNQLVSVELSVREAPKTTIFTFEYNDKGLISKKITTPNNNPCTETYEYDEKGNWIRCIKECKNDKQEITREIVYL